MKLLSPVFAFLIIFSALSFVSAGNIFACSCIAPSTPTETLKSVDAVFRGKVVSTNADEVRSNMVTSLDPVTVKFEVYEVWKGDVEGEYTVKTALESASCGFNFELGEEYVVYSTLNEEGELQTGLCSRTALASDAEQDLTELGQGETIYYALDGENGNTDDGKVPYKDNSNDNSDEKDDNKLLKDEYIALSLGLGGFAVLISLVALGLSLKRK